MTQITVQQTIHKNGEETWASWTLPEHITKWAFASDTWEAPHAENDVRVGGRFKTVMRAKDGTDSFDFTGTYTTVDPYKHIDYTTDDGRKVSILFESDSDITKVTETFETEVINPEEMQRSGWQALLDNFKKHTESL